MKISKTLSIFAAVLMLASCGNKSPETVLKMDMVSEPDSFFPWESAATDTAAINYNIYEGLMGFDSTGTVYPLLAESYSVSEDGKTYTFILRQGIKFHNGEEFTSEDAVYTYENLVGLNGYTKRNDKLHIVDSVSAPDKYTFEVTLKKPAAGFILLAIQPVLKKGFEYGTTSANGTGPYKLESYELHQKVVLQKNEEYWNTEKAAKIPTVEIYVVSDESAAISALQSGQLHMIQKIVAGNAKALESKFKVASNPQNMAQIFGMNTTNRYLSDENVRLAISCAINKQEVIDGVHDGYGTKIYSNFSPIMAAYYNDQLEEVTPYNLEKAKAYLAASKYPEGFDLTITIPANYQMHVDAAQIIANQLSKLNINCKLIPVEWTTWLDKVYSKAEYETTVIAFSGKLDPSEILIRYFSTYKRNFTLFNDADFDKAFTAAETEVDSTKRADLYKTCQKIITEKAPAVFICDPYNNVVMNKKLNGYKQFPISYYNLSEMWFD